MRTNLNVPYDEKDKAKRLGARWDAARKVWYVENVEHIERFMRWMPKHLLKPCVTLEKKIKRQKPKQKPKQHITHPNHTSALYSGDAPPWD